MKQISLLAILLLLSYYQQACRGRQQTASQTADSTTVASSSEAASAPAITGHLAQLGLTSDSHWRGINLGDEFTKVKATEKGEPFESDADHIGYTIELPNLESADILYYQTARKVSAIDVDLFLNSRQSVTDYQKELGTYFSGRYGVSKPTSGGTGWTGQTGETVLLKDVSKGKDFGLTIKIAPAKGATTASAK
ncbi:hypothetical protein [Spirosoma radiotolerans]|uniref:Lipoprotein n=1 Tax=Spirosoma radiotolerans TaxID=1379870 RepID=A0A0E3ZXL8_9BACT|nr:hypothetical protein [Spirosoma radiotolerans]AKD56500.1 hypothetical protein SD10_17905 [Spirosoma radiotolerans]